jgi:hypothetical protein
MNYLKTWTKVALINLVIVAFIGVIMRYKIGFEFPFLNQKYLMHGHSHFAFAGWVTHIIFVLMVDFLKNRSPQTINIEKYNPWIWANLICAYLMLGSFIIQGYGTVSIILSTSSIFINYFFAYFYYIDLRYVSNDNPSKNWFKAALFFNILSSIGTFYLAFMMATKNIGQHAYLGSIYFYLHFQYSGWFFFAIMGLIFYKLEKLPGFKADSLIFKSFYVACFPAYLLSILWVEFPTWVYILPALAVAFQLFGLYRFIRQLKINVLQIKAVWPKLVQFVFALVLFSLCIKLLLQAGSLFPSISKLAFGFRPIVIAYLHLVLLAFTSLFLIGYLFLNGQIVNTKKTVFSIILICIGVFLNEFVLMAQGVASFDYILIPYVNEALFLVSIFILFSIISLIVSNTNSPKKD